MKIAVQINTNNLGDIVVEELEERSTTNPEDQRAILVELLYKALYKITASYKIPREMLDLGDEEYVDAKTRHVEAQKEPKPSSAERNRQLRESMFGDNTDFNPSCNEDSRCPCSENSICDTEDPNDYSSTEGDINSDEKSNDEDFLVIQEHELPAIEQFLKILRQNTQEKDK